jgi:hypothetical protein
MLDLRQIRSIRVFADTPVCSSSARLALINVRVLSIAASAGTRDTQHPAVVSELMARFTCSEVML